MPAKKKGKTSMNGKKRAAKKSAVPARFDSGDRKFVLDAFDQTEIAIMRLRDDDRRTILFARLGAMRKKFKALPASKLTRERCERYMQEVTKLSREIG